MNPITEIHYGDMNHNTKKHSLILAIKVIPVFLVLGKVFPQKNRNNINHYDHAGIFSEINS
ncbi:hypothetical protein XSR1_160054 [Xenorhabdus szentirmaii DSM 16338]|uniref:Uncharacterized protein n=1 Tax=Xenorhabdus szentirmaii DSM 16338 TaxID=1427518 RepID=W1ITR8_9GAMM|nr:hypothetical protein XSR1_160054 [Xenorhabdus szentirmaii DSM 16338]